VNAGGATAAESAMQD
jgi:uncharacterized protein YlxW (UPF0749 family)